MHYSTASDAARAYLEAGLSVIPIKADGSKAPCVPWTRYSNQRPSSLELPTLFGNRDCGVAIVHGEVSGGTEVVDIDDGELLDEFVEALDHAAPGLWTRLCVIRTPRPGYHLAYRCEQVEGNQKLALRPPTDEEVAAAEAEGRRAGPVTLIETRGQGGYTIAPGSPGKCHPTGGEYVHESGPPLTELPTITPSERQALFLAAWTLDRMPTEPEPEPTPQRTPTATWSGESPGDAFGKATDWASILEPHGWQYVGDAGERKLWRRPGKSDGWSATTGNVSEAGRELLCVFSSNAYPFEGPTGSRACSSHSKFDAYARLNHNGDHAAAAKELARQGYGDREPVEYADAALNEPAPEPPRPIVRMRLGELVERHPKLNPPVLDGLLREGETGNIIAAAKQGKSWLGYGLSLSVATGQPWLNEFDTAPGKVLIVDNELHPQTLAHRIPKVADYMGVEFGEVRDRIDVVSLRGDLRSLHELGRQLFETIEAGEYKLVLLDAKYRFAEPGVSENDNAAETQVYNLLDRYAAKTQAAFVLIHHSSKGSQTEKAVTDVGAGAGAQSRAVDAHMVIRPHEEPGYAVLDAAVRSFAPPEPVVIGWEFPVWKPAYGLDPTRLKGRAKSAEERQADKERKDAERRDADRTAVFMAMRSLGRPETTRNIAGAAKLSNDRTNAAIGLLVAEGYVETAPVERANGQTYSGYGLTESARSEAAA